MEEVRAFMQEQNSPKWKIPVKLPKAKNIADWTRNVWPVLRKKGNSNNPTEHLGLTGIVDIVAYYPEYQTQIEKTLYQGKSVKSNWVADAPNTEQIGLRNTINLGNRDVSFMVAKDFLDDSKLSGFPAKPYGAVIEQLTIGAGARLYTMWWDQINYNVNYALTSYVIEFPLIDTESTPAASNGEPNFTDEDSTGGIQRLRLKFDTSSKFRVNTYLKDTVNGIYELGSDLTTHAPSIPMLWHGAASSLRLLWKDNDYGIRRKNYDGRDCRNIGILDDHGLNNGDDLTLITDVTAPLYLTTTPPGYDFATLNLVNPIPKRDEYKIGVVWSFEFGGCPI